MTKAKWGYKAKFNCATKKRLKNYTQLRRLSLLLKFLKLQFLVRIRRSLSYSIEVTIMLEVCVSDGSQCPTEQPRKRLKTMHS